MSKKKIPMQYTEETRAQKESRAENVIRYLGGSFDPDTYLFDDSFKAGNPSNFKAVHTIPEMMACIEANEDVEAEGIFLEADKNGNYRYKKLQNKSQMLEAAKKNANLKKMRETNFFDTDGPAGTAGSNAGLVGDDFVPLLGGPFNKQPYLYDYLRAHAYCFHEYHHHPFARAIVNITRDFVLGRGFRVDSDDKEALALWQAFSDANGLDEMVEALVLEGSAYGELMIWWLPNLETKISYNVSPGQQPSKGIIPRIRMMDPSTCWEIVTMPEDIKRVLFYWFVFPTQYQIKTGTLGGNPVPTSKFINQQIPAKDLMHFKFNSMSNEKRGRSDLFPVLGYLKWLRDCVNYKLIALKKQAAWVEDITVEGSQTDVDAVSSALQALGEFEPAGSRFIHTAKIQRQYQAPTTQAGGHDDTLDWGINMIAAGTQIPVTYFGLSKSAGQTKASALVGTEPVAKKMERRQLEVKRILQCIWRRFQDTYGKIGAECEFTFPEIITQDRSQKLKDVKFVEDCGYISRETAAPIAAKEIDLDKYDYETEKGKIAQEEYPPMQPTVVTPLTAPGAKAPGSPSTNGQASTPSVQSPSAVTKADRSKAGKEYTQ